MKTPWWFAHKTPLAVILIPVSLVYYAVSRMVYGMRKIGAYRSRRPIICIGNILAGGVGKTPVVRAVANYFDAPVVMRGYKKSAATGNAGDEALMLSRDGLQVHTGSRKSNIVLLNKQNSDSPIIMDDGFQNPRIKKDISILVFDEGLGCGNGLILPAGPLREPKSAMRRADAILIIRSARKARKFKLPDGVPVFYATTKTVSPYDDDVPLVAFAGIGYPKKFFSALSNVVARRGFADHYQYTDDDLKKLFDLADRRGAKLITTEKDWVRLPEWARDKIKFAKLETVVDTALFSWIKEKLNGDIKKAG